MRKTEKKTRKGNRFKLSGLVLKQTKDQYWRREVLLVLRGQNCVGLPREGERRGESERERDREIERGNEDEREREMMMTKDDILYEV